MQVVENIGMKLWGVRLNRGLVVDADYTSGCAGDILPLFTINPTTFFKRTTSKNSTKRLSGKIHRLRFCYLICSLLVSWRCLLASGHGCHLLRTSYASGAATFGLSVWCSHASKWNWAYQNISWVPFPPDLNYSILGLWEWLVQYQA